MDRCCTFSYSKLTRVLHFVRVEGRCLPEALATHLAHEGVLAAVHVAVLAQVSGRRERLGAVWALVRFVFPVRHLVVVQVGAGREALAANVAHVRFLSEVDATVSVERTGRGKRLAADVTAVRLLTCKGMKSRYIHVRTTQNLCDL